MPMQCLLKRSDVWYQTPRAMRGVIILIKAKAFDMILFEKRIDAQEALDIGLVHRVSPLENLMSDALRFAALLSDRPPIAVSCVLKAISAGIYGGDRCRV